MSAVTGALEGRAIVITGASRGIGAAAARLCAREGAAVVLGARSEELLEDVCDQVVEEGGDAHYVVADVSEEKDVRRLVEAAVERHGRIDGAFNNAGISQGGGSLVEVSEEKFERLVAVNLKGVWLSMRAEIEAMRAAGNTGSIVNMSSVGGIRGAPNASVYMACKQGVIGLTRGAAHDFGGRGLRVNALAPGTIDTGLILAWKEREPEIVDKLTAMTPAGRRGLPEEVAEATVWLLSDRASFVNGSVLTVDGGMAA